MDPWVWIAIVFAIVLLGVFLSATRRGKGAPAGQEGRLAVVDPDAAEVSTRDEDDADMRNVARLR